MKLIVVIFCLVSFARGDQDDFGFTDEQISEVRKLTQHATESVIAGINVEKILADVEEDKVTFRFFNEASTDTKGINVYSANVTKLTDITDFDKTLNTVFITHGWQNNCTESPIIISLRAALLANKNMNIFSVCWDEYSFETPYSTAFASVSRVGKLLGQFIKSISTTHKYSLKKFTLIGHSLGAHVSGFAGKELEGSLPHIVGLDPAAPLYSIVLPKQRLASTDAEYVEVIHTAGALLGVAYNVGDVDFYPNGGYIQPGCENDISTACAHSRAYDYYAESLQSNNFIATECALYTLYNYGICDDNDKAVMGGISYDFGDNGRYYLRTNEESPYARGPDV